MAACLLYVVAKMIRARRQRLPEKCNEIVICTASDQTTMDSIVSAQYGFLTFQETLQATNITILKMWSILVSKAPKVLIYEVTNDFGQATIVLMSFSLNLNCSMQTW